ncbi:DNA mismatch repair protein MutL [Muriicola jejuensis]|uniref:DNA mismatch repair protein MutL n=1 Tax=Muriicola jejuensis TaxID=504488 RepID=A0A6P0UC54_9FLAO|nr:DNA mismatch repair endonuclease MutL [Muriicola jejuensis]NER10824.1 DNA mismatch repair endonuclease MutL [Muriicola jejuensis]SMP16190.1 DNA mismatch repair protein MutL [Muriicola jejuensis]
MADLIHLLPDHVANQIAAGEVVQRPASVVKELLENAVDAGATEIELIVKDGGKALIQVVDNGSGMSETDARMSFERHATSKIQSAEDLFELHTKGFRGEALASIAAIAHVDMQTRPAEDEVGTHIRIEGSKVVSQQAEVCPKGTSISVKNLFFNIPARRNFLKSNSVEFRHITDEFHRVALAHPAIGFRFYHNGSELFHLNPAALRKRITNIFGHRMDEKLISVEEETQVVRIEGFICKPEYAKKSRGEQYFFVNDRFIKSPYLHHAVVSAYEGLLKPDVHPGYFLYLQVDPHSIDINIHPTKTEVKFDDEHTLYAILRAAVKHGLGQFHLAPMLDFEKDQNLETPYAYRNKEAHVPGISVNPGFNPFEESSARFPSHGGYHKKSAEGWENLFVDLKSGTERQESFSSVHFESEAVTGSMFPSSDGDEAGEGTTFQLRRKYIVTTIRSGMLIIDQQRAHQRVLYEKFLRSLTVKESLSQQLLFPVSLDFSPNERHVLDELSDQLNALGFVFEESDDERVIVKGLPPMVPEKEVVSVLDQVISEYGQGKEGNLSQSDMLAKALSRSVCVKTGDRMDKTSQLALVNDLFACKETLLSPFNKPIFITLTENEIDNKFK